MKVDKIVKCDLEIIGATLLSIEEAEQVPIELRRYDSWWWLQSFGSDYCVAYVSYDDSIRNFGTYVNLNLCVRPALQITNLESSHFQVGDYFMFGGKPFQIISEDLAFCLDDIGQHRFREDFRAEDANVYEKSDIKKYVDEWFEQNRSKSNECR